MVRARTRVLGAGVLDAVTAGLVDAVPTGRGGLLMDVGAGTGHHTAAVLDGAPDLLGCALELSPAALRVAARVHLRCAAVGADATGPLPLHDASVDVVTAVFAPLPTVAELARVTGADAVLVVITPTTEHLRALRARLRLLDIPPGKPGRLQERLADGWVHEQHVKVRAEVGLTRSLAADVVAMGPNAWHPDGGRAAALAALPDELVETVAVTVSRWRRG